MFEGAESLQNILASDLIPKLKYLQTCGGQEQDSRHGGLKNHDDYEEIVSFNWKIHWSSPSTKEWQAANRFVVSSVFQDSLNF